jgi:hypothetical protein
MHLDYDAVLETVTAVAVLATALIGRRNGKKAEEIHNEIRSTNGQTTAQNVENLTKQMAQNPETPELPHGSRREDA